MHKASDWDPIRTAITQLCIVRVLLLHGTQLAVSLLPVWWTIDHTFPTCHYVPSFYTSTKLYCLVTQHEGLTL